MTDSEKLDLLLSTTQQMYAETQEMRAENQEMRSQIQDLWTETQNIRSDIQEIGRKVNRLEVGQAELTRQIYRIVRKISDTYNLAPDAWGQGVENRELLENGMQKAYS